MKKFILFLGFVLVGTLSTLNSYAECDIFENEKITSESDNNLYLKDRDSGIFTMHETTRQKEKYSSFLQCGKGNFFSSDKRSCQDNTIIFVTEKTSRGSFSLGYAEDFTEGPYVIKCSTGFNDSWEKVGGIDSLPECENSAPKKYTITVSGKTIHCARKENRNGHEYCIGTKSGDICVESGNGKPAEKPKEEEKKVEEEQNERQVCDKDAGLYFNPDSQVCEQKQEEKPEEKKEEPKKEEPKKAPAKKKAAPKAKQPAPAKSTKKTPKEEFAKDCKEFPATLEKDNPDVKFTAALDQEGTTCTIKSTGSVKHATFTSGLNKVIEEAKNEQAKCEELKYTKLNTYSITCTEDGFTGTVSFINAGVTCEETQTFNDATGECVAKAAEEASQPAAAQAPEKNAAAAAASAQPQETNTESAASGNGNAAPADGTADGALNKLITEFKEEANGIVNIFLTRAPQVYEYQQQREKYGTDTEEIDKCKKNCESKTCRLNTQQNRECLKLNTDEWATEDDCKKSCNGKDKICKMDKDNDQKMWKFKCKTLPPLAENQYPEKTDCTNNCQGGKCVYSTHKERGHIFTCTK